MLSPFNFSNASDRDQIVFGAEQPGRNGSVSDWVDSMATHGIRRVLVLLSDRELARYTPHLHTQLAARGLSTRLIPIADYTVPNDLNVARALTYLEASKEAGEKVVVHCAAGMGRTGIILAAWQVAEYGLSPDDAVAVVSDHAARAGARRDPDEAGRTQVRGLLDRVASNTLGL